MAEGLLGRLRTGLGERDAYDAVSQCSRCGYCEQVCPTYLATGRESQSPRGRNQLVRLMLEGKLTDPAAAEEALSTCVLCGACSTACYAHVPTAEFALEGRRRIRGARKPHWLAAALLGLLRDRPEVLDRLMHLGFALRRWNLDLLGGPLLQLAGLGVLDEASRHLHDPPRRFLHEELRADPPRGGASARWLYYPPCGTRYLFPSVGKATIEVLSAELGEPAFFDGGCCGLVAYNYGELADARVFARRMIEASEKAGSAEAPIVGDCSSCVAHMKDFPKLFLEDKGWRDRAERFSKRVRDAIELVPVQRLGAPEEGGGNCSYSDSCRALHGQGISDIPREALRAIAGKRCAELPAVDCCGGAGAFAFVHPELSEQLLLKKVGAAASVQASVVATSSTSCLLQLARGFRKYYPEARVMHLMELAARRLGGMAKDART